MIGDPHLSLVKQEPIGVRRSVVLLHKDEDSDPACPGPHGHQPRNVKNLSYQDWQGHCYLHTADAGYLHPGPGWKNRTGMKLSDPWDMAQLLQRNRQYINKKARQGSADDN